MDLRETAEDAFQNKKIEVLLGYEARSNGYLRPRLFYSKEELDKLTFGPLASLNLARYLLNLRGKKVGIVTNGCTSRSLVMLINENQWEREDVVVIGVPCSGFLDRRKLEKDFAHKSPKETFYTSTLDQLALGDYLQASCLACQEREPVFSDYPLPSPVEPFESIDIIANLRGLSSQERFQYFLAEAGKCIRCYACRQACPLCYCESCFVESLEPRWLSQEPSDIDNLFWLITRLYHLAGRCVGCGACDAACPMGVDLASLLAYNNELVEQMFKLKVGMKIGEKPALGSFDPADPDYFWRER